MDILGGRPFSLRPPSRHKKLQDSYLLTWKDVFEKDNVMLMHELQNYIYHNEGMVRSFCNTQNSLGIKAQNIQFDFLLFPHIFPL